MSCVPFLSLLLGWKNRCFRRKETCLSFHVTHSMSLPLLISIFFPSCLVFRKFYLYVFSLKSGNVVTIFVVLCSPFLILICFFEFFIVFICPADDLKLTVILGPHDESWLTKICIQGNRTSKWDSSVARGPHWPRHSWLYEKVLRLGHLDFLPWNYKI